MTWNGTVAVRTCGGADAAERDDAVAGDPEVAVREEAAPFAAQALQLQETRTASAVMPPPPQIRYDGDRERWNREETHGTKNKQKSLSGWNIIPGTLEKGAR